MGNNHSNQAGYLTPLTNNTVLEDEALEDLFHDVIVGLTNIDNKLVRPNTPQAEPPNFPKNRVQDWVAFTVGVSTVSTDDMDMQLKQDGLSSTVSRNEHIRLDCQFYGPNARALASQMRDGFQINQNLFDLRPHGINYMSAGDLVPAPTLLKEIWVKRIDVTIHFRRTYEREYGVMQILDGVFNLNTDPSTN